MKNKKWAIKSLLILVVFLLLAFLFYNYINWRNNYRGLIYPGVSVGGLDLSGKAAEEALILLNKKTLTMASGGLAFQHNNKKITLDADTSLLSPDLSSPALIFNNEKAITTAFSYSHPETFLNYLLFKLKSKNKKNIPPAHTIDEQKIITFLNDAFKELNVPPANASFALSEKTGKLNIVSERPGKEINYDLVLSEIKKNADHLSNYPITLKTRSKYPEVKAADLKNIENEAQKIIGQNGLKLTINNVGEETSSINTWTISAEKLLSWLSVNRDQGQMSLSLDQEKIKQYILTSVSPKVDLEPIRPRFEVIKGRVVNWQTGKSGRQVDPEASAIKIVNEFLKNQKEISLIVNEVPSENIDTDTTFNIKEIIGTGHSNFAGSPTNRRKNIQIGANAVHGILLAPNEEFSLVKVLGDVSEETGYLPELVIKGNKTTPEYGGGLCQVGTTIFRAALGSGLPITARRNHSYRVSYYEPAGTDAAVYIPQPDVRFLNDTPNYILIQARIVKNDIYFDFWGTKDGRIATTSRPVVYNIVKPEPTKYIETTELPLGEKKCTEKAHNGADAYFDYKVIYPDTGTTTPIKERRFNSHYVPWQEVCLIGKGAASSSSINIPPITTASSSSTSTNR